MTISVETKPAKSGHAQILFSVTLDMDVLVGCVCVLGACVIVFIKPICSASEFKRSGIVLNILKICLLVCTMRCHFVSCSLYCYSLVQTFLLRVACKINLLLLSSLVNNNQYYYCCCFDYHNSFANTLPGIFFNCWKLKFQNTR